MRWNVTTSAYEVVKRSPPGCVKEIESLVTRVLSEADMDDTATADSTEYLLRKGFEDRVDHDKFEIMVEENSWGYWPRPKNLYSWIALCGFEPPCGIVDEGDFDQDFLVLSFRRQRGESLHLNVEKLSGVEKAMLVATQKGVLSAEFDQAMKTALPTYALKGADLFSLPIEMSENPVLRSPQEILRQTEKHSDQAIAATATSVEEALSLSSLFETAIEKTGSTVSIIVVEPQTEHHTYWVVCLNGGMAESLQHWFQPQVGQPTAH